MIFTNIQTTGKKRNYPARIIDTSKLSFTYKGEIMTFPDIWKLREFTTTRPPLQEILKGIVLLETRTESHTIMSKIPDKLKAKIGIICNKKKI